ncbi:MAG: hypothetical protein P1U56_20650 [Saprospiraceae bacterium]|nr:hypothetical protein [Saprospiraceae bacterium]
MLKKLFRSFFKSKITPSMQDQGNTSPSEWFMYHGGYNHGGNASKYSSLDSTSVNMDDFVALHTIDVPGSILSVPAVVDGYIYVGLANSHDSPGSNGGLLQKYNIETGEMVCEYRWDIQPSQGDTHGFTGMGCTPTIINGKVYFVGFDAVLYCLKQDDLTLLWKTDLRNEDENQNQPITNTALTAEGAPQAEGWSSPLVIDATVDGENKSLVILGIGEGENPALWSFVFCMDADTGKVVWIYCTCQYHEGLPNPVNQLPSQVLSGNQSDMYTVFNGTAVTQGCSIWSAICYDEETKMIYATTGQPASPVNSAIDRGLPSVGWSSGILALDAATGEFKAFTQMPAVTSYRPTDLDVDIGSAATIYTIPKDSKFATNPNQTDAKERKVIAVGCKNGGFMVCDAHTLDLINYTSLLPKYKDGTQIEKIDVHPPPELVNDISPYVSNETSNKNWGENYFGPFNTAAVDPNTGILFVGIGGPNYHGFAPGIDSKTTPFVKAIHWDTLLDAWPMDDSFDPPRYKNVGSSMYSEPGDSIQGASGLSSPAVVNDVVFVSTSKVSIYAYKVSDGTFLWSDDIGPQTGGLNGGYGYCLGPAIWGKYVVAGALIKSDTGGVLKIYGPKAT